MDGTGTVQAMTEAPGSPGIPPTWCSSAKDMVGCALESSRLWFTLGRGIVNEVYYPRIDIPQIRDLGFIIADGNGFWVEVKRLHDYELSLAAPGIPAVKITHRHPRFILTLRITPDPQRDVLLIETTLDGDAALRPYVLLAPHLGGTGHDNHAWADHYRGRRILWAEQGPFGLALAASDARQRDGFDRTSAGFVGVSDGWRDFTHNGAMHWEYGHAGPGNVALTGSLPRRAVLALGFGSSKESAATLALSALPRRFDEPWHRQIAAWTTWHNQCRYHLTVVTDLPEALRRQLSLSAMVLRVHQDQTYPGAMVASLSIPWGNTRDERGGYHLVWPRDLVECAGALLALGADDKAREILRYLIATQHGDGHWCQNQWLGGKSFWEGIQLDEAAFPVLLAAALVERDALDDINVEDMVRRSLSFIAQSGPASDQDRWEENAGVNTYTLTICIAALVAGAQFLPDEERDTALAIADYWNSRIEDWTVVYGTPLAQQYGVSGYFVRTEPRRTLIDEEAMHQTLPIKNRLQDPGLKAEEQIGNDFLQLVRFGLRHADDPMIKESIKVADALLRVETPSGPAWHRYNGDGYGEHDDGSPFDGTGVGRAWPLLTGERGHFELAAGNSPLPYLQAMAAMSGPGGMLPEQVWDGEPLAKRGLYPGRPTGSAMPLAWAHAEFIKLAHSWAIKHPFDRPSPVWQRYHGQRPTPDFAIWTLSARLTRLPAGKTLRIYLPRPATILWRTPDTDTFRQTRTSFAGLGLQRVEIDTRHLMPNQCLNFNIQDTEESDPQMDYTIKVNAPEIK
jgi:glucoamylase